MSMSIQSIPDSPTVFGSISVSHTAKAGTGSQAESADRDTYTTWEALWGGITLSETVNENGTVIKTLSAGMGIADAESAGSAMFSVNVAFQPGTYEPGDLKRTVEMLASTFKVAAAAVRCAATGESLFKESSEPNRLELVYQDRKAEVSDSFSEMVSGYLESANGTRQEAQKVRDSVQSLFTACEDKFQTVMEKTPQAVWMGESIYASIINLQKLAASFPPNVGTKGLYSLQELESFAMRVTKGFSISG